MSAARFVRAMVDELDRSSLIELERSLGLLVGLEPTASERRQNELGHLAGMIGAAERLFAAEARLGEHFQARVPRKDYDASRPAGAPSGRALAKKFGSWIRACQAAYGRDRPAVCADDGDEVDATSATQPRSQSWATNAEGRQKAPPYTRAEVIAAIRKCAADLGRPVTQLTSNRYYCWVAAQRRSARERGMPSPRLPTQRSVERHFKSWREIRCVSGNSARSLTAK